MREAYSRLDRDPEPDHELLERTRVDLEKRGLELPDPDEAYGVVVATISDEIAAACSEIWSVDLSERCAIDPLRHPAVNARCFKSPECAYALVIHRGLMNLLHKSTKLVVVAHGPAQTPLLRSTSAAKAGHVDSSRTLTVYSGTTASVSDDRASRRARPRRHGADRHDAGDRG